MPGWPLLAASTASIARVRIVSTQSRSRLGARTGDGSVCGSCARAADGGGLMVRIFASVPDAIRIPDELLAGLPDFPFESQYREFDGLRLAHLDVGSGPPVIFFHG